MLSGLPLCDAISDRIDPAADLMPWHSRQLQPRVHRTLNQHIAVTDATGFHLDANLPRSWRRNVPLDNFERPARLRCLCHFHTSHVLSLEMMAAQLGLLLTDDGTQEIRRISKSLS
jgi:hypothetical protein